MYSRVDCKQAEEDGQSPSAEISLQQWASHLCEACYITFRAPFGEQFMVNTFLFFSAIEFKGGNLNEPSFAGPGHAV